MSRKILRVDTGYECPSCGNSITIQRLGFWFVLECVECEEAETAATVAGAMRKAREWSEEQQDSSSL